MLRNKEFLTMLFVTSIIMVLGIIIGFSISEKTGVLILIVSVLLFMTNIIFTIKRYRHIAELSHYMREISSGKFSLDVRDNAEGELSILKSEIYKVTTILSEQKNQSDQDKHVLIEAISDISHQLKTPLTSMKMMAELLNDPTLPADKRQTFTEVIGNQLERIDWLVSALLIMAKVDARTITFKKQTCHVSEMLKNAAEPLHIPIEVKDQQIEFIGDETVSIIADKKWTTEAIVNILKNSVEHTPEGGTITLTWTTNHLFTEILITDNGPGIPKEDLPYLFKRFYRGKSASQDSVGIGLSMAHQLIHEQHGDLSVQSILNEGTTFILKFYHDQT